MNALTRPDFVSVSASAYGRLHRSDRTGNIRQYHESIKLTSLALPDQSSFELLAVKHTRPTPTIIAVLYRPPKLSNVFFFSELLTVLTILCVMSPKIILMGDFNIHFDNTDNMFTKDFKEMLIL